jgi:hypothetical protein
MKRGLILLLIIFSLSVISAEKTCDLEVSMINQDPYPAVPGEYVKLVFQLEGVSGVDCSDITFDLKSKYPIEFNPGETGFRTFKRVNYLKDYDSNILITYQVRVNEDAVNGANEIEVVTQSKGMALLSRKFNLEVSDIEAEFELYVKDYNYDTNEMTLEVLNIADTDIEALALEIPKQEGIQVKGSNREVVGDLDSNEYTTADFEAIPSDGQFLVNLIYSDAINTRRMIQRSVIFDSSYFIDRKADQNGIGMGTYIIWIVVIGLVIWWFIRRSKKKKKNQ